VNERNNVLLVVLDSVRANNTSLHGYSRDTTPFLSAFADRSTVYTQARAPGIHSIASHVSLFTGTHVEEHGAIRHTAQIDPSRTVWHELQTEFGYATGLFTNNRIVSNASNLGEAFEYVHEPSYPLAERLENKIDGTALERLYYRGYDGFSRLTEALPSDTGGNTRSTEAGTGSNTRSTEAGTGGDSQPTAEAGNTHHDDRTESSNGGSTGGAGWLAGVADMVGLSGGSESGYKTLFGGAFTDAFLEWEARQNGPWAACINLMDAHSPYEPESRFDRWADERHRRIQREEKPTVWETLSGRGWDRIEALESLYDGTIRQTDAILSELVSALEKRGLLSETLLVVTSDHGETFSERSRLVPDVRLRGHKWGIHELLTHVPLVVSYPGQQEGTVVDEVVSLTDLPAAMRAAATDEHGPDRLTGGDVVLASTFRLPEEKVSKYSSVDDIEQHVGPWRAVYESHDGGVRKFARKGERGLTLDIKGPGEVTVVSQDDDGRVAEAYNRLTDADLVTQETAEIDEELEQQLEDLGYIR